jgi:outer membrane lipoprotein-sorting protein
MSRISHRRLLALVGAVAVVVLGAGVAIAASGSDPKPPARPLGQALLTALQSPAVDGVSARIHFTNRLLPPGTLPKGTTLPFGASADGRLWLRRDGRLRLDVRSDAGAAEITYDGARLRVYDAGANTVSSFRLALPSMAGGGARGGALGALGALGARLGPLLSQVNVSGAIPSSTAGRPTYTIRISPKDDGGLLGAAEIAFDAGHGIPLRAAVYEQGSSDPVLELAATQVHYGAVSAADVTPRPHPGARTVDVDPSRLAAHAPVRTVSGVAAVRRRLGFPLAAPATVAGLPRRSVHLIRSGRDGGALVVYGRGLGAVLVFESRADGRSALLHGLKLPQVNIHGRTGTELATALGTIVTVQRDGVRYTVAGSVPPVAAENAARALTP